MLDTFTFFIPFGIMHQNPIDHIQHYIISSDYDQSELTTFQQLVIRVVYTFVSGLPYRKSKVVYMGLRGKVVLLESCLRLKVLWGFSVMLLLVYAPGLPYLVLPNPVGLFILQIQDYLI